MGLRELQRIEVLAAQQSGGRPYVITVAPTNAADAEGSAKTSIEYTPLQAREVAHRLLEAADLAELAGSSVWQRFLHVPRGSVAPRLATRLASPLNCARRPVGTRVRGLHGTPTGPARAKLSCHLPGRLQPRKAVGCCPGNGPIDTPRDTESGCTRLVYHPGTRTLEKRSVTWWIAAPRPNPTIGNRSTPPNLLNLRHSNAGLAAPLLVGLLGLGVVVALVVVVVLRPQPGALVVLLV